MAFFTLYKTLDININVNFSPKIFYYQTLRQPWCANAPQVYWWRLYMNVCHTHIFPRRTSPVLLHTGPLLRWTTLDNLFKLQMLALFSLEVKQAAACS